MSVETAPPRPRPCGVSFVLGLLAVAVLLRQLLIPPPAQATLMPLLWSGHWLGLGVWAAALVAKQWLIALGREERERLAALTLAERELARFAPLEGLGLFGAGGTAAAMFPLLSIEMSGLPYYAGAAACLTVAAGLFFLGWSTARPGYWPKPQPDKPLCHFFPEVRLAVPALGLIVLAAALEAFGQASVARVAAAPLGVLLLLSLGAPAATFGLGLWYCLGILPTAAADLSEPERRLAGAQVKQVDRLLKAGVTVGLAATLADGIWRAIVGESVAAALGEERLISYAVLAAALFVLRRPGGYSSLAPLIGSARAAPPASKTTKGE